MSAPTPLPSAIRHAGAIVTAYVGHNALPAAGLPDLIATVHASVARLGAPPAPEVPALVPPVPIRKTVSEDHIVSLEDGRRYRTLKRHLAGRGLTPEQYRQKWGLPPDYPMVAPGYAAQRSDIAKANGLGRATQAA